MLLVKETISSIQPDRAISTTGKEYLTDFIVRDLDRQLIEGSTNQFKPQILATGFEFTQWRGDSVIGRNGISVEQHWNRFGGIEAYKSVAMNEFPNLFYLLGPNSGRGHTSVLFSIEW